MSCYSPNYALLLYERDGKKHLKFMPKRPGYDYYSLCRMYGEKNILTLPCGSCDACLEARSRSWAARCVLEASCHANNCFLTLTYKDSCLPKFGLCKKDIQDFLKRLRKEAKVPVRYFLCGEYGEKSNRPHWHLIIFGYRPSDLKMFFKSPQGDFVYRSETIEKLWKFGISSVGDMTYASACYVARYCMKKGHPKDSYKPFNLMSLKPGIGENYFREHCKSIYNQDKIIFKFSDDCFQQLPFRYFDKLFNNIYPEFFENVKQKRIDKFNLSIANQILDLALPYRESFYKYKADLKANKLQRLKRNDL